MIVRGPMTKARKMMLKGKKEKPKKRLTYTTEEFNIAIQKYI